MSADGLADLEAAGLRSTFAGMLARLELMAAERVLRVAGERADVFETVARARGWKVVADDAPVLVQLGSVPVVGNERVVLVVAPVETAALALPLRLRKTFRAHVRLAARLPLMAGLGPVVGERLTKQRVGGWNEFYFSAKEPHPAARGDAVRAALLTVAGTGVLPVAPATLASLWVALLAAALLRLDPAIFQLVMVGLVLIGSLGCYALERWAMRRFFAEDPREVVLDEVAGMALTLLFLPAASGVAAVTLAFFTFRLFDIFKPGIHWLERRKLRGSLLWDDLLAGLYAGAAVWVALAVLRLIF